MRWRKNETPDLPFLFQFFPCKGLTLSNFCYPFLSAHPKAAQAAFKNPPGTLKVCATARESTDPLSLTAMPTRMWPHEMVSSGFSCGPQVGTFCQTGMRCLSQQVCPYSQHLLCWDFVPSHSSTAPALGSSSD